MQRTRFTVAGLLLGVGLGGFFDGIILHQVLQWHHMLTSTGEHPASTVAGLESNTLWDGFFHLFTYAATIAGLVLLMTELSERRGRVPWSTPSSVGTMLVGWGVFNLAEGIVDHHLLGIHHVRTDTDNQLLWDLGFLAWGLAMVIGGWILLQRHQPEAEIRSRPQRNDRAQPVAGSRG